MDYRKKYLKYKKKYLNEQQRLISGMKGGSIEEQKLEEIQKELKEKENQLQSLNKDFLEKARKSSDTSDNFDAANKETYEEVERLENIIKQLKEAKNIQQRAVDTQKIQSMFAPTQGAANAAAEENVTTITQNTPDAELKSTQVDPQDTDNDSGNNLTRVKDESSDEQDSATGSSATTNSQPAIEADMGNITSNPVPAVGLPLDPSSENTVDAFSATATTNFQPAIAVDPKDSSSENTVAAAVAAAADDDAKQTLLTQAGTNSGSNEEKIAELNKLTSEVEKLKEQMEKLNYSDELILQLQNSISTANFKSDDLDKKIAELNILKINCQECIK